MRAFLAQPRFASLLRPRHGVLGPTLDPRSGRTQRTWWVPRAPGRGIGWADPPSPPSPPRRGAPPRTRVGAGWWRPPAAGTPQPSLWAAAAAFTTRRAQFGPREPALPEPPTPRSPRRAPRTRARQGPGCGPELLEPDP
ncbi:hypothetical protein PAL_GLEAN10019972 [Pteropus alecto]|uniref:Uncharacterized protein n=1 Tax=Pteropus alecto TaxID=9402 RepID=L5JSH3_PTEAL|nr:hypothetical protein PAL_GLEAN10019972 [Pteropus alecto]